MRDFELEKYFSKWEFTAKHHMTASDIESLGLDELLSYAEPEDKQEFDSLWLGYTETWGASDLREQIASTYDNLDHKNILCLAGAGEGIYIVSRVLLSPEDHAIVTVPNYQSAETTALEVCDVSGVELQENNHWQLDLDELASKIRRNTKLISINFPNNPTGAVMSKDTLNGLVELCRKHDLYLFCDEVYRGVEMNPADTMPQVADVYEKGLSLNVMSKAYGLSGLRIGWIGCQDSAVLQRLERYKHYLSICNSAPSERLALIALKNRHRILDRNRKLLQKNVNILETLFDEYRALFHWQRPQGGCVAFPKYLGSDGVEAFCKSLIENSGVLLLPASIYRSDLIPTSTENFRIGFGRGAIFERGLEALSDHLQKYYSN